MKSPADMLKEKSEEIEQYWEEIKQKEAQIESLEKENRGLQKTIERLISKVDNAKKVPMSMDEFNDLNDSTVGRGIPICSVSGILLELRDSKYMDFLSKIDRQIPNLKNLDLAYVPENNEVVKNFLWNYFPEKLEGFGFNYGSELSNNLDEYIDDVLAICPRIEKELLIYCYEVSQENLIKIISQNRNKKVLGFLAWKLELLSVPDLSSALSGCTIEKLDFTSWGHYGDWSKNLNHFSNLLNSLAKCKELRASLKEIVTMNCGFNLPEIKKILDNWGFTDIKIVNHYF